MCQKNVPVVAKRTWLKDWVIKEKHDYSQQQKSEEFK
jgi:hypothetical protein